MFCRKCGQQIPEEGELLFCPSCGEKILKKDNGQQSGSSAAPTPQEFDADKMELFPLYGPPPEPAPVQPAPAQEGKRRIPTTEQPALKKKPAQAEGLRCGSCGTPVSADLLFCPECGAKLGETPKEDDFNATQILSVSADVPLKPPPDVFATSGAVSPGKADAPKDQHGAQKKAASGAGGSKKKKDKPSKPMKTTGIEFHPANNAAQPAVPAADPAKDNLPQPVYGPPPELLPKSGKFDPAKDNMPQSVYGPPTVKRKGFRAVIVIVAAIAVAAAVLLIWKPWKSKDETSVTTAGKTETGETMQAGESTTAKSTEEPADVSAGVGEKATFRVEETGAGVQYQWERSEDNGKTWESLGENYQRSSFTITLALKHNGLRYRCKITKNGKTTYSRAASVSVAAVPVITSQPTSVTVSVGEKVTLKVSVKKEDGLTYQWERSSDKGNTWESLGENFRGASLSFTAAEKHNGIQYRCVITNENGRTVSNAVTVGVNAATTKKPNS